MNIYKKKSVCPNLFLKYIILSGVILFFSCSEKNNTIAPENLQEYITLNKNKILDEVIACAASKENENNISYIFYYPIETATNIQYFETENALVNKDNFELYKPIDLEQEAVFNGYLERFIRNNDTESWCVVTYETEGKIHVSNPIRLKNNTKPTEWSESVTIDLEDSLMPKFIWEDGIIPENVIYFEVISNEENDFISGTYTFDTLFQFYKLDNVVLNITNQELPVLNSQENYNFTMMGVSEDNWVNLVIQKTFTVE